PAIDERPLVVEPARAAPQPAASVIAAAATRANEPILLARQRFAWGHQRQRFPGTRPPPSERTHAATLHPQESTGEAGRQCGSWSRERSGPRIFERRPLLRGTSRRA